MFDLPKLEKKAREKWNLEKTFEETLKKEGPLYSLLEGPPTMNGAPGVHHVEARAFKDLYGRLKTMQGFRVPRRAGWDCHGLPVELGVAAELGLKSKEDVETYGVERFNQACRESVLKHQKVFEKLTEDMGYWLDMDNPWRTMDDEYVEKMWQSVKVMHEKGLLKKHYRVSPWCSSCASALSSHEVAQGAGTAKDFSVTVRFYVPALDANALVWTTTPWTLAENLLLGVDPKGTYKLTTVEGEKVLTSESYPLKGELLKTLSASELEGLRYKPLWPGLKGGHFFAKADFVKADAGTGLVHLAPAYGKDDFKLSRELGLDFEVGLNPDGSFSKGPFEGLGADLVDSKALRERGVKTWSEGYHEHERAHCWRCGTLLVELARPSWFLETTKVSNKLLEYTDATNWQPGPERYRRWVEGNVDWALTRERFWGTPLPVWTCEQGHMKVPGSREELSKMAGKNLKDLELHRPYVDEVTLPCECGLVMKRETEVLDTWFDSGAAPVVVGQETSQLVAEGVDQTRGWFYTLSAVAALLGKKQPFENVLSLGLVLDANGEKMSKSKGNVVDPFKLFEVYGADSVRWALLTDGDPWAERRFSEKSVQNSSAFLAKVWACLGALGVNPLGDSGVLEKWLESRLQNTVGEVGEALENFNTAKAGASLELFVEDLSARYLRARRNNLNPESQALVLRCLKTLALMMAPFTPHFSEALWGELGGQESVHLQKWPEAENEDRKALDEGNLLWELVEEAWSQRAQARVRLRQPLSKAYLSVPDDYSQDLLEVFKQQTNVKEVELHRSRAEVKVNWRHLGKRMGKTAQEAARELKKAEGATFTCTLNGQTFLFKEGEDYALEKASMCVLDMTLTQDLLEEGEMADLLRTVVEARKARGMKAEAEVTLWFTDPAKRQLAEKYRGLLENRNCFLSPQADLLL